MRHFLSGLGYRTDTWGLRRNFGIRTVGPDAERLTNRIAEIGEPVALVGVSLGGILARLMALRHPELVREVVTIASPYAGDPRATNVWRAFQLVTGERLDDPIVQARMAEVARPLPVPATAIWSASDGLVNGAICHDPSARSIEVRSSHYLVQLRPEVLIAVATALAAS